MMEKVQNIPTFYPDTAEIKFTRRCNFCPEKIKDLLELPAI